MTETTLIAVPCRVITLQVELGADSGASTLEALVLEAVAGGRGTVKELGELFSLPHRLMLDVVHGLWSRGFLAVDFATNALESTQAAEAVLGGTEGHAALATSVQPRRFLFDPVTATVLPYKQGRERVPQGRWRCRSPRASPRTTCRRRNSCVPCGRPSTRTVRTTAAAGC
ncbi:hypothetical protein DN402_08560 [Streptomyces sp. SW4]|nr:hypothetical protein DN402_08560 [Streptomyces sp. SW4]